jgi:prophage maintenance system killer protein
MTYRDGLLDKAATAIRDIAGRHLFDDANKRTAQAVAERLLGTAANPAQLREVIFSVAKGELRSVEEIAAAL